MTLTRHRYTASDPRLGRHVEHDERSRAFALPEPATAAKPLVSVDHGRAVPIFDQGQVGSCTANAAGGALASGDLYDLVGRTVLTEDAAQDEQTVLHWYSLEQTALGYGPYPPNDNGGSGLAIAKVLKKLGLISGYRHAFSVHSALAALQKSPTLFGIPWYSRMFTPDSDGQLHIGGRVEGGHEVVSRQYVARPAADGLIWIDNSWGPSWGVNGRAYMTASTLADLLAQQGDCTVFTVPTPKEAA